MKDYLDKIKVESNDLMTVNQLSGYLKLSKSYIYTLTSTKRIPHIKLHGKVLFDKNDIKEWLKTKTVAAK